MKLLTESQRAALAGDLDKLNLSKYVEEIATSLAEVSWKGLLEKAWSGWWWA